MTTQDKVRLVTKLVKAYKELDRRFRAAEALFGCDPETPFQRTMYTTVVGGYIDAVSELVGDDGGWLSWFIYDNDCGKRALEVNVVGQPAVKVKSVARLIAVIEARDR